MCTDSLIIIFNANSDLTARKHFGSQDRGDATEANGFILSMECLEHSLDLLINRAVLPLYRPGTQILCRTKTPCKTLENSKNSFKKKKQYQSYHSSQPGNITASWSLILRLDRSWMFPRANRALSTSTFLFSSEGFPARWFITCICSILGANMFTYSRRKKQRQNTVYLRTIPQ